MTVAGQTFPPPMPLPRAVQTVPGEAIPISDSSDPSRRTSSSTSSSQSTSSSMANQVFPMRDSADAASFMSIKRSNEDFVLACGSGSSGVLLPGG